MLALPLTAAVLLHASPTQMGLLTAMEILPFVLFSLPSGVWLDRVRKLPVYVVGEVHDRRCGRERAAGLVGRAGCSCLALRRRLRRSARSTRRRAAPRRSYSRRSCRESGWWRRMRRMRWPVRVPRSPGRALAGALIKLRRAPIALLADAVHGVVSRPRSCAAFAIQKRRRGRRRHQQRSVAVLERPEGRSALRARTDCCGAGYACAGGWQTCHQAATVVNILFRRARGAVRAIGRPELQCDGCSAPSSAACSPSASAAASAPGQSARRFRVARGGWLFLASAPAKGPGVW